MLLAEKLAADPTLRGRAFNFSNEIQITVRELVDRILNDDGLDSGARRPQRSQPRDRPSVSLGGGGAPRPRLDAAVLAG